MKREFTKDMLAALLETEDIAATDFDVLVQSFVNDTGIQANAPERTYRSDPRNSDRVFYSHARAKRPHDNASHKTAPSHRTQKPCVICEGRTTKIIDVAPLSDGFTFINKNLFPIVHPAPDGDMFRSQDNGVDITQSSVDLAAHHLPVSGLHLLQWTSSKHDADWQNMALTDRLVVIERLSHLEQMLLTRSGNMMPDNSSWGDRVGRYGYVCIGKNFGHLVGGSLAHGHQQIVLTNVAPRRFIENLQYQRTHGETFSAHMLRNNPPALTLCDYGDAVLLVPYFMKRPADMMLILKNTERRYLHELSKAEKRAVAQGWHDAIRAILHVMPLIGREAAYNAITHNGPGAGLYFEFLPYTQEIGAYEHLGLYVCQGTPETAFELLRDAITKN